MPELGFALNESVPVPLAMEFAAPVAALSWTDTWTILASPLYVGWMTDAPATEMSLRTMMGVGA